MYVKVTYLLQALTCLALFSLPAYSAAGREGAAFLDIPVGARPAALGAAYTALASDAYAATWNPAGLAFVPNSQFAGQHLSYLGSLHYEFAGLAIPTRYGGIGVAIQYLGSGDMTERNASGDEIGEFSSSYASYQLAYGKALWNKISLGITAKTLQAKISDSHASALAADFGAMVRLRERLTLAATLTNIGTTLRFEQQEDPLPRTFRLGGAYEPADAWLFNSEFVLRNSGVHSFHFGTEWRPLALIALRAGYRTDTVQELSGLVGFTTGMGLTVWGQEFSYAWLPYSDLGHTHYFSLVLRWGASSDQKRNLIQYHSPKRHNVSDTPDETERIQMIDLLNEGRDKVASPVTKP